MKLPSSKYFPILARWSCALLAAWLLPASVFAQADGPARWLFVFETSPAMQKRLPATALALKNFFSNAAGAQLHDGDSIGVWTCGSKLHTGEFPLATWEPAQAADLTSNLMVFLHAQRSARDANLASLQPLLNSVVADSAQFTAVIFCDGDSAITATPYDTGVNQTLHAGLAERKKNAQPFVVVLRSQAGKYIGCTVNFPPGTIDLPPFLPPPPPPVTNPPPPRVVAPVKTAPVAPAPSLVIVGTNVSGALAETPTPPETNLPPVTPEKIVPAPISVPAPTPPAMAPPAPVKPLNVQAAAPVPVKLAATNPPPVIAAPVASDNTDHETRRLLYAGAGLFVVVVIIGVLIVRSRRQPQSSLITSSMQDDPRRK
jgi:hypothetical protein